MTLLELRVMSLIAANPKRVYWEYGLSEQLQVSRTTLHSMLHKFADIGWLSCEREHLNSALVSRTPRRLYRITEQGITETHKAIQYIQP